MPRSGRSALVVVTGCSQLVCSVNPTLTLQLPGVNADQTIAFTHDVWFETSCTTVGFLTSTASPQPVTIKRNPPWTLAWVTAGPLILRHGQPSVLELEVGGPSTGSTAVLGIDAPWYAREWFSGLPMPVKPGTILVKVPLTPHDIVSGTFQGILTEPGTGGAGWEQTGALNGVEQCSTAFNGIQLHPPRPARSRSRRSGSVRRPASHRSAPRFRAPVDDTLCPLVGEYAQVTAVRSRRMAWFCKWEQNGCRLAKWSPRPKCSPALGRAESSDLR
ncbi:hypothetical protein JD76_03214 [Micromonospora endolithica]|nr:hypothetical protein JD76_03214 [Micromonospora endolithica]